MFSRSSNAAHTLGSQSMPADLDGHCHHQSHFCYVGHLKSSWHVSQIAQRSTRARELVTAGYMTISFVDEDCNEARYNYTNRRDSLTAAGSQILKTNFPTPPTFFPSNFTVCTQLCLFGTVSICCSSSISRRSLLLLTDLHFASAFLLPLHIAWRLSCMWCNTQPATMHSVSIADGLLWQQSEVALHSTWNACCMSMSIQPAEDAKCAICGLCHLTVTLGACCTWLLMHAACDMQTSMQSAIDAMHVASCWCLHITGDDFLWQPPRGVMQSAACACCTQSTVRLVINTNCGTCRWLPLIVI